MKKLLYTISMTVVVSIGVMVAPVSSVYADNVSIPDTTTKSISHKTEMLAKDTKVNISHKNIDSNKQDNNEIVGLIPISIFVLWIVGFGWMFLADNKYRNDPDNNPKPFFIE